MSIIIKGMEMPTGCWACFARRDVDIGVGIADGCELLKAMIYDPNLRPDDCPLVSVPPHGRLIDTSSSVQTQLYDDEHEEWTDVEMTVEDYLGYCNNDVPTVIPAEEGE